ncbi:MAG: hypothetical protein COB35_07490 [Gammaproteobacteria bacterium]|nr:MAG: hypothetical protein COB35_07490 [Gammaproteobacteria bacterium]
MLNLRIVLLILLLSTLSSCQITQSNKNTNIMVNESLLLDQQFPNFSSVAIESEQQIFYLSPVMDYMVADKLLTVTNKTKRARKLIHQIFKTRDLGLVYLSTANLVASEAYNQNTANCLSLTIMAYALAKKAHLNINFQEVDIPEYWERNGEYNMLTGHVNLILPIERKPGMLIVYGNKSLQIDFDPYIAKKTFKSHIIDKNKVIAMYYNNKAAQAIVDKNYTVAYAYLNAAVHKSPNYSNLWGNLGLLYRLTFNAEFAEKTYSYALALDKNNLTTLSNYAVLLKMIGNVEQAKKINTGLEQKRRNNPYYQALLADEAAYRGDFPLAIKYYKKAIKLDKRIHEFYFGIAKIYYKLEQFSQAKRAIKKAIAVNRLADVEKNYIAKLNFLKANEVLH